MTVALTNLDKIATRELVKQHIPHGLKTNREIAKIGSHAAKVARDDLEKNLGKSVISEENSLNYKYIEDKKLIEDKKIREKINYLIYLYRI